MGVIMYILLSSTYPFVGKNNKEVFAKVAEGKFTFYGPHWKVISKPAIDLIQKLICKDPTKRLSAAMALNHPWF